MKVLIGGGSGFVGRSLAGNLTAKGHQVDVISRSSAKVPGFGKTWTWEQIQKEGLPACDVVINMSGSGIMDKRWSEQRKKELLDSRIGPTNILVDAIQKAKDAPKLLISGSAIGYYPSHLAQPMDDDYKGPAADDFAGYLCDQWEKSAFKLQRPGVRVVVIRTAVVLGHGGALAQMLPPFKLGLGGRMGSGQQGFPWVHMDDEVGIIEHVITHDSITGPILSVSPESKTTTNQVFTNTLGEVLHRPTIIPVPELALKIALGESHYMLTQGAFLYPKKALETGYKFKFPGLKDALQDILGK